MDESPKIQRARLWVKRREAEHAVTAAMLEQAQLNLRTTLDRAEESEDTADEL